MVRRGLLGIDLGIYEIDGVVKFMLHDMGFGSTMIPKKPQPLFANVKHTLFSLFGGETKALHQTWETFGRSVRRALIISGEAPT